MKSTSKAGLGHRGACRSLLPTRLVVSLLVLLLGLETGASAEVLLSENFDSYEHGDWPAGFYQFEYDYEHYPGTHVVAEQSAECPYWAPSSPNCFMNTNPYPYWGGDVTAPFPFDPAAYGGPDPVLDFGAYVLFPSASAGTGQNDVDIKLVVSPTDRRPLLCISLGEVDGGGDMSVFASDGGSSVFLSDIGDYDEWVHLRGVLHLATEVYDVYANGVMVGENLNIEPGLGINDIGAIFLGKGFAKSGPGYFDDVLVQGIPEPAALSLLALGGLASIRRR